MLYVYTCLLVGLCCSAITLILQFLCHCGGFFCALQTMAAESEQVMLELELIVVQQQLLLLKFLQGRKERKC